MPLNDDVRAVLLQDGCLFGACVPTPRIDATAAALVEFIEERERKMRLERISEARPKRAKKKGRKTKGD